MFFQRPQCWPPARIRAVRVGDQNSLIGQHHHALDRGTKKVIILVVAFSYAPDQR